MQKCSVKHQNTLKKINEGFVSKPFTFMEFQILEKTKFANKQIYVTK